MLLIAVGCDPRLSGLAGFSDVPLQPVVQYSSTVTHVPFFSGMNVLKFELDNISVVNVGQQHLYITPPPIFKYIFVHI